MSLAPLSLTPAYESLNSSGELPNDNSIVTSSGAYDSIHLLDNNGADLYDVAETVEEQGRTGLTNSTNR